MNDSPPRTRHVLVPKDDLSADVLSAVLEEFITREGTDYGQEHSLEAKVTDVRRQLDSGEVVIVFDPESETVNLVRAEDLPSE